MISAIDTSALLAVLKGENEAEAWISLLIAQAALGPLRICEVTAAELGAFFPSPAELERALTKLRIELDPSGLEACCLAGRIFRQYREAGGRRSTIIPDFLIGAHAMIQADVLIAADRGYLKRYYQRLIVLQPAG